MWNHSTATPTEIGPIFHDPTLTLPGLERPTVIEHAVNPTALEIRWRASQTADLTVITARKTFNRFPDPAEVFANQTLPTALKLGVLMSVAALFPEKEPLFNRESLLKNLGTLGLAEPPSLKKFSGTHINIWHPVPSPTIYPYTRFVSTCLSRINVPAHQILEIDHPYLNIHMARPFLPGEQTADLTRLQGMKPLIMGMVGANMSSVEAFNTSIQNTWEAVSKEVAPVLQANI